MALLICTCSSLLQGRKGDSISCIPLILVNGIGKNREEASVGICISFAKTVPGSLGENGLEMLRRCVCVCPSSSGGYTASNPSPQPLNPLFERRSGHLLEWGVQGIVKSVICNAISCYTGNWQSIIAATGTYSIMSFTQKEHTSINYYLVREQKLAT